ncbi:hypothetical protein WJX74_010658 [Apatococcus lobatus]|uniref:Uncharacterized protein n=1 Tax=Apatococcus lobatus TaxID=904363 RepID=A0AAW1SCG5_9CHLO
MSTEELKKATGRELRAGRHSEHKTEKNKGASTCRTSADLTFEMLQTDNNVRKPDRKGLHSIPLLASSALHKPRTRCGKACAPRRRRHKPRVSEDLEQQLQELQEDNLQLQQQLTWIEVATQETFQQLQMFQQLCDDVDRQNEALLAELQRLQAQKQQQQQMCTSDTPASDKYTSRSDLSQRKTIHSWGPGTSDHQTTSSLYA